MHESLRGNTVAGSTLEALIFAIMQCLRWPRESESCVSIGDRRRREKMKNEKKWFCPAEGLGRSGLYIPTLQLIAHTSSRCVSNSIVLFKLLLTFRYTPFILSPVPLHFESQGIELEYLRSDIILD